MLLERTQIKCSSQGGSCWFGEGPRTAADGTQPKKPAPSSPAASQTASLCTRTLGIVFSSLPPPCPSSTAPDPTSILPWINNTWEHRSPNLPLRVEVPRPHPQPPAVPAVCNLPPSPPEHRVQQPISRRTACPLSKHTRCHSPRGNAGGC